MRRACFIMMSPIAFIISPRISSMSAFSFGSAGAAPPIIGMPIVPPIIWRHRSIIGMPAPIMPGDGAGAGVVEVPACDSG